MKKNLFLGYTLKFEFVKKMFFHSTKYILIEIKLLDESNKYYIYQKILILKQLN